MVLVVFQCFWSELLILWKLGKTTMKDVWLFPFLFFSWDCVWYFPVFALDLAIYTTHNSNFGDYLHMRKIILWKKRGMIFDRANALCEVWVENESCQLNRSWDVMSIWIHCCWEENLGLDLFVRSNLFPRKRTLLVVLYFSRLFHFWFWWYIAICNIIDCNE